MHVPQSDLWGALCTTCNLLASTVSDAEGGNGCSHRQKCLESCHAACHTTPLMSLILLLDRHCCWALSWLGRMHHTWRESCCRPRPLGGGSMSVGVWQACAANAAAAQARHGIPKSCSCSSRKDCPCCRTN